jgi:hypothetical protein
MPRTAQKPSVVFEEIVDMTSDYIGPAARRFVTKIIRNHLSKSPSELKRSDVTDYHKVAVVAFAHVTKNSRLRYEFSTRLLALKTR